MSSRSRLLLVTRSREAAGALQHMLSNAPDLSIETRLIDEHDLDPLGGVMRSPDLLLLKLNGRSHEELGELLRYGAEERPPLIVIGDASNAQSMRIAMQAGARDFLTEPVLTEDLLAAIELVSAERRGSKSHKHCELVAFINAKGGSGATFLACNVAHLFTSVSNLKTAIVDLDLQFGTLPQYLDVQPKRGLLEALDVADDLDGVAIDAYLTRHESGLSILAGLRDSAMLQQDPLTDRFNTVLNLLEGNFERLVVDLPRQIDPFSALVLERASKIVLVLQQSVPSLHDATRMHELLTRNLAIPSEHIQIVVNRYSKNSSIELGDIQQSLQGKPAVCIPNDFRNVTESINMGVPIYEHARRSPTTKSLLRLEAQLGGRAKDTPKGFLPRFRRTG